VTDHEPPSPWAPHTFAQPASLSPYGPPPAYGPTPIEVRLQVPPTSARGMAVAGVVLGGLALLGVLLLGVFAVVVTFFGPFDDGGGGGGYGPMRGTVASVKGSPLSGQTLADEVTRRVRDDGGYPEGISCPGTVEVAQDVTTVCHGTDDGEDSSFVVFFEDASGVYTLLEI
jgi:hypothetical protein